jgi:circadian clock protein KaiB
MTAAPLSFSQPPVQHYRFRLFVAGSTPGSATAIINLRKFCEEHLAGRYEMSICDVLAEPAAARACEIVATPTLLREEPVPGRFIGDISSAERFLVGDDHTRFLASLSGQGKA